MNTPKDDIFAAIVAMEEAQERPRVRTIVVSRRDLAYLRRVYGDPMVDAALILGELAVYR